MDLRFARHPGFVRAFLPQKTVVCLRSSYPLYSFDEIGFLGRTTASPPWLRSAIFAVFVICWVGHTLPWMPDAAGWAQLLLESWSWRRGLMPGSQDATGYPTPVPEPIPLLFGEGMGYPFVCGYG